MKSELPSGCGIAESGPPIPHRVLLKKWFSYRKIWILLTGSGTIITCMFAIALGIFGLINGRKPSAIAIVFILAIILPLIYAGGWLTFAYWSGCKWELQITRQGVTYGSYNWRWENIQRLFPIQKRLGKYILVVQLKGILGQEFKLPIDELIDESEYKELRAELLKINKNLDVCISALT